MRILIVEDDPKNMEEARRASSGTKFKEFSFEFFGCAGEALTRIREGDDVLGVITDFFFPRSQPFDLMEYFAYIVFFDNCVESSIEMMEEGHYRRRDYRRGIRFNRLALAQGKLAGYGGVVALECWEKGVPFVMATNMCFGHSMAAKNVSPFLVLSPLFVRVENFPERLLNEEKGNVNFWVKAIETLLDLPETVEAIRKFREKNAIELSEKEDLFVRKREEEEIKIREKIEKRNKIIKFLKEKSSGVEASEILIDFFVNADRGLPECIFFIDKDEVVFKRSRSQHAGAGGCGYFDQLFLFYHGQVILQEFQWRDQYSCERDKPYLALGSINGAKIIERGGGVNGKRVKICVEVSGESGYGAREILFEFDDSPAGTFCPLSSSEIKEFNELLGSQIGSILMNKDSYAPDGFPKRMIGESFTEREMKILSGKILSHDSALYQTPILRQKVFSSDSRICCFVTEEQIDHQGADPQIRYELFLIKYGWGKPRMILSDCSYQRREGRSGLIFIIFLDSEFVLVQTDEGQKKIKIDKI